ncbi:MAG: response regulator transcription factor [Thermoleophilia bacterium]
MDKHETNLARILVVEDDEAIREAIVFNLKKTGYHYLAAANGLEGLRLLRRERPDLMILDLMLPDLDGWKLCEQAREEGFDLPIIICSARTSEFDKVQGLAIGADDYMAKPFGMSELMARVGAHLRRQGQLSAGAGKPESLTFGELVIDPERKEAFAGDKPLGLTSKEFSVLYLLAREFPLVISREEIYKSVWGYEMLHGDRSVDVFVRRIRKKLAQRFPDMTFLQTHYGFGYRFEAGEAAAPSRS